jgi:hypothetical protein
VNWKRGREGEDGWRLASGTFKCGGARRGDTWREAASQRLPALWVRAFPIGLVRYGLCEDAGVEKGEPHRVGWKRRRCGHLYSPVLRACDDLFGQDQVQVSRQVTLHPATAETSKKAWLVGAPDLHGACTEQKSCPSHVQGSLAHWLNRLPWEFEAIPLAGGG